MRLNRIFLITLVLAIILVMVAGILWFLDLMAVISLRDTLENVPIVNKMVYEPEGERNKIKKPLSLEKTPAEKENERLKKESENLVMQINQLKRDYGQLAKQLEVANKHKQTLTAEKESLSSTLESLQLASGEEEASKLSYRKLAGYYAEMKPQAAVSIMDNLSDEVIIGILQYLEDDQVAKILSAMKPERAAELVNKMKQ